MDEKSFLSEFEKIILAGKKFQALDDPTSQKFLELYFYGIADPFVRNSIRRRVKTEIHRQLLGGTPFRPPRLHHGDFVYGFTLTGQPILSGLQGLNAHSLEVSNTGGGKTNRSMFWALQVGPRCEGMWLIDIRKAEYRHLRPLLARVGIDLKVIRSRKFRINPLQVPLGVDPADYAAQIADCLVKALNLPPRAAVLLRSTIVKLYRKYGVFSGSTKYPTLFDLFQAIRNDRQANPQARQSILDNLEAILLELGPEVLAYHQGWAVDQLAKHHLVMELTMMSETAKDLILNYLILAEFISRIARGISNPNMSLYISFDEAQRVFSQKKESSSHHGNAIGDNAGLVRGAGIGLNISALSTYDLSARLPSLTSNRVIGRCGSLSDYVAAGRFVGLNQEQIDWMVHHMVPGLFVGQVSEGNWRYPFLFRVPLIINKVRTTPVSNQEADRSLTRLTSIKVLPARI